MLLRSAVVALAALSSVFADAASDSKTTKVKPVEKLELDARAPMLRWSGDLDAQASGKTPVWQVVPCKVQGCGDACPEAQNCRAAAPKTDQSFGFNFTGTSVTVFGNIWTDFGMTELLGAADLGDATITIDGKDQPPVKLANSGGKLLTLNLGANANQSEIIMNMRPQGYLTVNTVEVTLPTAQLNGTEVEQNDLSPDFPDLTNQYTYTEVSQMDHFKQVLSDAGVTLNSTRGSLPSGGLSDSVFGKYVVVFQQQAAERKIPSGSYYAILKGPRTQRQSDCWVVWEPKPPSAEAVQLASGYSPTNFTEPHEMSAIALDPKQDYTVHVFSQGNGPWGCVFQQLVTYHTSDESPLPSATGAAQPSTPANTAPATTESAAKSGDSGKSNIGAIVGGVVGGVLGGLLLAGLIVGLCWWRNRKNRKHTRGHAQQVSSGSDMTHRSGQPVLARWRSHSTVESLATSIDSQSDYGDRERQTYPDMALDDAPLPSASPQSTPGAVSTTSPRSPFGGGGGGLSSPGTGTRTARSNSNRATTVSYNTNYSSAPSHTSSRTSQPRYEHTQTSYNSVRPSSEYENYHPPVLSPKAPGRRLI